MKIDYLTNQEQDILGIKYYHYSLSLNKEEHEKVKEWLKYESSNIKKD